MSDAPKPLQSKHLMELSLVVDADHSTRIGQTGRGFRTIAPINGGEFTGDRLRGTVRPGGADWVLISDQNTMWIDVRLTLESHDNALIYLTYQGQFKGDEEALADLRKGQTIDPERYSLSMVAKFECGDARYDWLNTLLAVGTGRQSGMNPVYSIYEIQ